MSSVIFRCVVLWRHPGCRKQYMKILHYSLTRSELKKLNLYEIVLKCDHYLEWGWETWPFLFTDRDSYSCLRVLVHGSFHILSLKGISRAQHNLQEKGKSVVLRGPGFCYSRNMWPSVSLCASIFFYSWSAQIVPSEPGGQISFRILNWIQIWELHYLY